MGRRLLVAGTWSAGPRTGRSPKCRWRLRRRRALPQRQCPERRGRNVPHSDDLDRLDKGSDEAKAKGDLKDKVKQVADGGLTATLGSWLDHVRLYGNAGAHPDLFGDVSLDEAEDVARLTETLIELLYVTPARIAQRQAERLT